MELYNKENASSTIKNAFDQEWEREDEGTAAVNS